MFRGKTSERTPPHCTSGESPLSTRYRQSHTSVLCSPFLSVLFHQVISPPEHPKYSQICCKNVPSTSQPPDRTSNFPSPRCKQDRKPKASLTQKVKPNKRINKGMFIPAGEIFSASQLVAPSLRDNGFAWLGLGAGYWSRFVLGHKCYVGNRRVYLGCVIFAKCEGKRPAMATLCVWTTLEPGCSSQMLCPNDSKSVHVPRF